jgi:hypothetical protein
LHIALNGEDCAAPLSTQTFSDAVRIVRYFSFFQLEVLQRTRAEARKKQCDRLKEIFDDEKSPITLRDLMRRHGLKREEIIASVKSRSDIFGISNKRLPQGGRPSIIVFLKSNPPPGWNA